MAALVRPSSDSVTPAWLFPVPVRRSCFRATGRAFARYNVEVDLGRIVPVSLDRTPHRGPVLFYDFQTHLEGNWPGRLGSGRGGVYLGRYLKGVGRTPAAANWRSVRDRYHGSGHLSVGSALRERLITLALSARGLDATIVPCESVLLRPLAPAERHAVRSGRTSSDVTFTPADARMAALTVKPADFARPANFVFALHHFNERPRALATLFLDLERYLRPPGDRANIEGAPAGIARALAAAFGRGLRSFEAFARAGLHWVFVRGNVTLDGRFADVETPHFFGSPFVGVRIRQDRYGPDPTFLGFEEFELVYTWRRFLAWLRAQVRLLSAPGLLAERESRLFLAQLAREIDARFPRTHLLYADSALERRAVANLLRGIDLGPRGRARLYELARFRLRAILYATGAPIPDAGWHKIRLQPAPSIPASYRYETPDFLDPRLTPDAEDLAATLWRLSAEQNLDALLRALLTVGSDAHPLRNGQLAEGGSMKKTQKKESSSKRGAVKAVKLKDLDLKRGAKVKGGAKQQEQTHK